MAPRRRITLATEEHMWALRCQGLRLEAIAFSTGFSIASAHRALRRARRRRLPPSSPVRHDYTYPTSAQPPSPALRWGARKRTQPQRRVFANRLLAA